jgi:hypothetical protein
VEKLIIGRVEKIDFPKLGLIEIDAKIDTGAFTSSLHCHHFQVVEKDGKSLLVCRFLDPSHPEYNDKEFLFEEYEIRKVKSSNGMLETRFSVVTEVEIFGDIIDIELTLTERGSMKYAILLGRKFLNKRFVVDTTRTNVSHKQKTKKNRE